MISIEDATYHQIPHISYKRSIKSSFYQVRTEAERGRTSECIHGLCGH
jgi:hypothetical protein